MLSFLLRTRHFILIVGVLWVSVAVPAFGQNALAGPDQFPQFRTLSGLSGGGYGLDWNGWGSLSGPTAYSTPISYVLGHDQFRLTGAETYFNARPISDSSTTGKASLMYGHSFSRYNVAASYFVKSGKLDHALNVQVQMSPDTALGVSYSIGVQDIRGHGGSSGQFFVGDTRTSRSVFGAATIPVQIGKTLAYVSGGVGTRRFQKGFGSVSCPVARSIRLWVEHDGYAFNEGFLIGYTAKGSDQEPRRSKRFEADLVLGLVKSRYPTVALTVGF